MGTDFPGEEMDPIAAPREARLWVPPGVECTEDFPGEGARVSVRLRFCRGLGAPALRGVPE